MLYSSLKIVLRLISSGKISVGSFPSGVWLQSLTSKCRFALWLELFLSWLDFEISEELLSPNDSAIPVDVPNPYNTATLTCNNKKLWQNVVPLIISNNKKWRLKLETLYVTKHSLCCCNDSWYESGESRESIGNAHCNIPTPGWYKEGQRWIDWSGTGLSMSVEYSLLCFPVKYLKGAMTMEEEHQVCSENARKNQLPDVYWYCYLWFYMQRKQPANFRQPLMTYEGV